MDEETWLKVSSHIVKCRQSAKEIDSLTRDLLGGDDSFFKPLLLREPGRGCAELVFLRGIFWLHSLFHECAGRAIRFCHRQSQFPDGEKKGAIFLQELRALRTHAAHNLDGDSESDRATEFSCLQWYKRACHGQPPMPDSKWNFCTDTLFTSAISTLRNIHTFLLNLGAMSDADLLIEEFGRCVSGQISPYLFDEIVSAVAEDLGRTNLNLEKFRADHLTRWASALETLRDGFDFRREARLLVEQSFLESPERPPISGRDIIGELNVPKGPEVGRLLGAAKALFDGGIKDKHEILNALRASLHSD